MGKKAALNANVLDVEEGGRHEADQMGRRNKQTKTLPSSWDFFPRVVASVTFLAPSSQLITGEGKW